MTPAARTQAVIDLLGDAFQAAEQQGLPADMLASRYFAQRRYAGKRDRQAIRDLLFDVLRRLPYSAAYYPPRVAMLAYARSQTPDLEAHFGSDGYAPAALQDEECRDAVRLLAEPLDPPGISDAWIRRWNHDAAQERMALTGRAALCLRVNIARTTRDGAMARLAAEGLAAEPSLLSPFGLRLPAGARIESTQAFADGLIDVQDEASQIFCRAAGVEPGMTVVDLCAGAGGKSLGLAMLMAGHGRLIACDPAAERLERLRPRAVREGADCIERRVIPADADQQVAALVDVAGQADIVVVDAPCTGTGTWRRNPEARWRVHAGDIVRAADTQAALIGAAARIVRPGGRILYGVCSLLPQEGEDVVTRMAQQVAGIKPVMLEPARLSLPERARSTLSADCLCLTPNRLGCDGFFIAAFDRLC
mgnify:CR=1 FL=1